MSDSKLRDTCVFCEIKLLVLRNCGGVMFNSIGLCPHNHIPRIMPFVTQSNFGHLKSEIFNAHDCIGTCKIYTFSGFS